MNPTRKPEAKDSGPKPADHRSSAEIAALHRTHLFPNVANYYQEPIAVAKASGMILTDQEGREYLDFFGGILTIGVGHCRPEINEAITRQIGRMGHISSV